VNWKNLTIGKKIGVGFGVVIILLIILGILSFTGVGGIVKNASDVIDGKTIDGELAQKEVDHLNWIGDVNTLLTDDNVHKLNVQTDHTKCGFGKWLYGEGRKNAETLVPSLAPMFEEIEAPHKHLHDSAISISKVYKTADHGLPAFIAEKQIDHLNWANSIQGALLNNVENIETQTDHTLCAFGKWLYSEEARKTAESDTVIAGLIEGIKEPHEKLHGTAKAIISEYRQVHPGLLDTLRIRLDDHRRWAASVAQSYIESKRVTVETNPDQCTFGKWLNSEEVASLMDSDEKLKATLLAVKQPHADLHKSAIKINNAIKTGSTKKAISIFKNETNKYLDEVATIFGKAIKYENGLMEGRNKAIDIFRNETTPELRKTQKILDKIMHRASAQLEGQKEAANIYATRTTPSLKKVQTLLGELRKEASSHILTDATMLKAAQSTKRNVAIMAMIATIAGLFLAFIIAKGIIKVLTGISTGMDEGANQVASAAGQVSSASQSLAEGSSEQAASIEETSSSMEEMSSMTKKNAENAGHANTLMQEANQVVGTANESMTELTTSMAEITKASEETQKIIKTIDEIAFQTNLLALNAAVEAARAGEAGAGFAVVADEVRNLAMRAANAAKNTSELIEDTMQKVGDGSEIVASTNEAFVQVAESAGKVGELVAEIAEASNEQSSGIDQVNTAVNEMDKVVQQNAANAEESASASEELSAQAETLKDYVGELVMMVTGKGTSNGAIEKDIKAIKHSPASSEKKTLTTRTNEVKPDQVIPFDDNDDFEDF
jgi:methyl-accepting chemotaxis protein